MYWQTEQYDHSRENSIHVLPESIPQTPIETPKSYGDDGSGRMLSFWSSLMSEFDLYTSIIFQTTRQILYSVSLICSFFITTKY